MEIRTVRKRLNGIFSLAPELEAVFKSTDDIEVKRHKIRLFLTKMLTSTFNDDRMIPPLEWVMARDAIRVFRRILTSRSESLAGYSFLEYLNTLMHSDDISGIPKPHPAFFSELLHLVRGVTGKTGIYSDKMPAFLKHEGRKAARLRSNDLSRLARTAQNFMEKYTSGLGDSTIKRRRSNRRRIMKYFGASREEWDDWRWQLRNTIRNAESLEALIELSDDEKRAVQTACREGIPFGITPYYLSLIDYHHDMERDRAVRAQVIPTPNYVEHICRFRTAGESSMDFMLERDTSPVDGITRRYPMIVILKPFLTCPQICVYCQRNWEIEDVSSSHAALSSEKLEKALDWIEKTREIREVLVTGGDPFMLSGRRIDYILSKLSRMDHIERIRLGSRTPVTLPQRISDSLVEMIGRYHRPGRREILVVTHFEHPYEITPESMEAVQKFRKRGLEVCNQMVFTFFNSRKFEAAALRNKLRLIGVTPYYTFNTKGKEETSDYQVPIARLLQEQKEEARLLPGSVRTDEIVFNVPGLGKNYLRAVQHHDIVSILPDGRRVYEFHPWEKKLSLAETYIYTDVSIYHYLKRLKAAGESTAHYRSIWYYY